VKTHIKNVVVVWYGDITLEIRKENPIKSIRIKAYLDISIIYPLGIEILTNTINSFEKDF
jgi:hypothetical protein